MKLQQIQEDITPDQYIRVKRRYDYLMTYRLSEFDPTVRVEKVGGRKLELAVRFQHAPWLNTFKSHFVNKDLPEDIKPRAQLAVEHFAEQFAEKHGIPYTRFECHWNLVTIMYVYE